MSKKYLFITCGFPFSGKTTLVNVIRKEFGLPIVDLDIINKERNIGINGEKISDSKWVETYKISYERTRRLLIGHTSVIYDATNFTIEQRKVLIDIAEENEVIPVLLLTDINEVEARKRLLCNRETNARYDVRDDDFDYVVSRFEKPSIDEAKVLNYKSSDDVDKWINSYIRPLLS